MPDLFLVVEVFDINVDAVADVVDREVLCQSGVAILIFYMGGVIGICPLCLPAAVRTNPKISDIISALFIPKWKQYG